MSTIDLNRLIVRKSYFVPVQPSDLKDAVLKELNACDPPIYSIHGWFIAEEHVRSWTFERLYKHYYVREYSLGKRKLEKVKELAKKYDAKTLDLFFDTLMRATGDKLDQVHVSVTATEANGCFINVECLPILYRQIRQVNIKAEEYQIQDAYLTCERRTRHIFEGGLSATLVAEEKKRISEPTTILLVNDSFTRQITERIDDMIANATDEILILGWVGTYYLNQLQKMKKQGIRIRAITHKPKELKKDPIFQEISKGYKKLTEIAGLECISVRPDLHGRAIIVDSKALIGSMDLNSYSLTGPHIELAVYTEDPEIVRGLRRRFNKIFVPLKEK